MKPELVPRSHFMMGGTTPAKEQSERRLMSGVNIAAKHRSKGGRIHTHERDTNDSVSILGETLQAPADLQTKYNETAKLAMGDSCRRNYGQRIRKIINFWKENDSDYYAVGVRQGFNRSIG